MSNPVCERLVREKSLAGQVAIITGSSRGIGREMALLFARAGARVVVTAKSTESTEALPGSIFTVAKEIEEAGGVALPVRCDVRREQDIEALVAKTVEHFGRIDILVCNAGAMWWRPVTDTPANRYDLMQQINARASFLCARACLPHMLKQNNGHIIVCSPPIDLRMLPGMVGYCMSKFGMTLLAHGLGMELRDTGVSANSLWPATTVESQAVINFRTGSRKYWRKASVLADAALLIVSTPAAELNGRALIDEDFMREKGVTDFTTYRCDPETDPPRMTPIYKGKGLAVHGAEDEDGRPLWTAVASMSFEHINRGRAREVNDDDEERANQILLSVDSAVKTEAVAGTSVPTEAPMGVGEPDLALSDFEQVIARITHGGRCLRLELNRPKKLNSMTDRMLRELRSALRYAKANQDIVCLVITGVRGSRFFTAGFDIAEFAKMQDYFSAHPNLNPATDILRGHVIQFLFELIRFEKPVVVGVNGGAVGVGTTMLPLCDVVVATKSATFRTPFSELSIAPEAASSFTLPQVVGYAVANDMLMLGRTLSADRAFELGLVGTLCDTVEQLQQRLDEIVDKLISIGPEAVNATKKLLRAPLMQRMEQAFHAEMPIFAELFTSQRSRGIMRAFFMKAKL